MNIASRPYLIACAAVALTATAAHALSADDVLPRVREAVGLDRLPKDRAVRLSGEATFLGAGARFEAEFDAAGRSIIRFDGPISLTEGFDGEHAWSIDIAGEHRRLELGERESTLFNAAVISGGWFSPDSGVAFTLDESRATADSILLNFNHEAGSARGAVEINRADWRPVKWTLETSGSTLTGESRGTITADGFTFPAAITQVSSHGMENRITVTGARLVPLNPARFSPSPADAADHSFNPAVPATLEIKRAPTGHLLVRAKLDADHEGWFIFDTGAGINCLEQSLINDRGYERLGEVPAVGVGGSVSAPFVRARSITVGPLTVERPLCIGLDMKALSGFMGETLSGIIGYGVLARSTVEIDMTAPSVSIHDPARFTLARGEWSPLIVYERHPCLTGAIEGHPGVFKIDTGAAGSTLAVHAPAVERLRLLEGRDTTPGRMGGVGGFVDAPRGTITLLELAGTRHENIEVQFAAKRIGAFADEYTLGNIGGKILAPYTLILDYTNNRAALVER